MPLDLELQQFGQLLDQLRNLRDEWDDIKAAADDPRRDLTPNQRRTTKERERARLAKQSAALLSRADAIAEKLQDKRRAVSINTLVDNARPKYEGLPAINTAEGAVLVRILDAFTISQRRQELRTYDTARLRSEMQSAAATPDGLHDLKLIRDELQHRTGPDVGGLTMELQQTLDTVPMTPGVIAVREDLAAADDLLVCIHGAADAVLRDKHDHTEKEAHVRQFGAASWAAVVQKRIAQRKQKSPRLGEHLELAAADLEIGRTVPPPIPPAASAR